MKRAALLLGGSKNKKYQCSKCHQFGHNKSNRICPMFTQITDESSSEDETDSGEEMDEVFSDDNADTVEESTADESASQASCEENSEVEVENRETEAEVVVQEDAIEVIERCYAHNERLLMDDEIRCDVY